MSDGLRLAYADPPYPGMAGLYRPKDHSPTLIVNTIEQVPDAYDKERAK